MRRIFLLSVIFLALVLQSMIATAIVPQRYIKTQYPINFTISSFNKVIESGRYQGEDLAELYWERAVQYGDLHHYDEAIADYDKAIELKPKFIAAYLNRAVARARLEKYDAAFADFAVVLEMNPNNVAALNSRAMLNFLLGKYQDAINDFSRYLKLRPDDIYRMLWLYISEKHLNADAPSTLPRYLDGVSLDLWPGAVVRLYLGQVPVENVIKALNDNLAAWSNGSRCEAFFYIGEYFLLQGNKAEALKYFRNAVQTKATGYMEYEFAIAYTLKL